MARLAVLVVEDDEQVAILIERYLTGAGFHVERASDGAAGLALATRREYGALVLDDRLPVLSGLEVLRHLRADGRRTPALILTAFPDARRAREVETCVTAAYATKPITRENLVAAVRRIVAFNGLPVPPDTASSPGAPPSTASPDVVRKVLDSLAEAGQRRVDNPMVSVASRPVLLGHVGRLIATAGVSFVVFVAGCRAFRTVARSDDDAVGAGEVVAIRTAIAASNDRGWSGVHSGLSALVGGADVRSAHSPFRSKAAFALALGLDESAAAALLARDLGLNLADLRLLLRVRPVLAGLAHTSEHVDQIGYKHGYLHKSQVEQDVARLLGITPRRFRALTE